MRNQLNEQQEQPIQVEQLNLLQLQERIQKLREKGYSYDQIFLTLSNSWQYGILKLPQVTTLAHLRTVISETLQRQVAA